MCPVRRQVGANWEGGQLGKGNELYLEPIS